MIARRAFLQLSGAALAALASPLALADSPARPAVPLDRQIAAIERRSGGRLGVALLGSDGVLLAAHRGDERFPMCSTFKFLLAAAVLQRAEAGRVSLQARIPIAASDLLGYAPVSKQHVGPQGLPVRALCEAAVIWSDNTAANLLLPLVDGPAGVTAFARAIGDPSTRLDHNEPALNNYTPGVDDDTTTPRAMAGNLRTLLLGDTLGQDARRQLGAWLLDNRTGDARLRAGVPRGWKVGDKTGSNGTDTSNDIAILWPSGGRAPLLLSAYLNGATVDQSGQNAALAAVARAVVASVGA